MATEFELVSERRKRLQEQGEVPKWYTSQGLIMFERKYSYNNETVKGAFERVAETLSKHYIPDVELAKKKFFDIMWKGFLAPSTPVLCNTGTKRGFPVSCAGSYVEDSISGFYKNAGETAILSKLGFGTSSYCGDVRPRGKPYGVDGEADGVVPVIDTHFDVVNKTSQGSNRRGSWAGYLPVSHEDFWEVAGYLLKNMGGVNIGWMFYGSDIEKLKSGDEELIKRFNHIMYLRCRTGKGYIWKPDTANRNTTEAIKNSGIDIKASNLCNEVALPQNNENSFSCVLSSLNLSKWDDFEEDTVFWATVFLDCVCSEFIKLAKGSGYDELSRIISFTEKARALGLGTLGFHTYLQQKMIAFESLEAHFVNIDIFKSIKEQADKASEHLAKILGEPEWCKGTGKRNATLMAIAPNMSSAILCGSVSQGIEPFVANAFNQGSAAGDLTRINPEFLKLAKQKGRYSEDLMSEVAEDCAGSVQHLDWLSDDEKLVFKTAYEINQEAILRLASARSPYIDQWQSLNLFFSADEEEEYIANIHKQALLDDNIKGLYYLRSSKGVRAIKECVSCEG